MAVWPVQQGRPLDWPKGPLPDPECSEGQGLAYGLGHAMGSIFRTLKATPALISAAYAQRRGQARDGATHAAAPQRPADPQAAAQQAEARKIARGRLIWIATAAVGAITTAFASGLLSIEFVDDEDEERENDEEDQEQREVEGAGLEMEEESEELGQVEPDERDSEEE